VTPYDRFGVSGLKLSAYYGEWKYYKFDACKGEDPQDLKGSVFYPGRLEPKTTYSALSASQDVRSQAYDSSTMYKWGVGFANGAANFVFLLTKIVVGATIALIGFLQQSELSIGALLLHFVQQFVLGGALGLLFGWLAVWLVNRTEIPNRTLYPIMLLCLLFFSFALTNIIQGNGYLAVYITGIVLGNAKLRHRGSINHFFDGITWLVQIILFIMLGLLVNPNELLSVGVLGVLIALFMMVVGRPLAVHITLLPFRRLGFKGKGFLSWVGLRGAAPIIFATYPVVSGVSGSSILFNIVFIVTLLSLLIQGMTITPMARLLGLAKPAPPEGNFIGVEIPDELGTQMQEREVRKEMLAKGDELRQIELLETELVILVRRKNRFIVPKGALKLHVGDILLIVSEHSQQSASDDGHHQLIERIRKSLLQ